MSVATESPSSPSSSSTSSGDDFLAMLDAELERDSAETTSRFEEEEGDSQAAEGNEEDLEEQANSRNKRRKLSGKEDIELLQVSLNPDEGKSEKSGSSQLCPPHPGFMWSVCIRCGKMKSDSEDNEQSAVPLRYIHKDFELSDSEIARLREDDLKKSLPNQKLYLVLDLDHTLLNSARFIDVSPEEESYITSTYFTGIPNAESEEGDIRRSLYKLPSLQMWTKLRPFVHKFLEQASEMYEMYVYTMGERGYALRMAKLLDPSGKYFGTRVISQGDSTHRHQKNLDVVLGAESAVVILDDTEHVWPKHRSNLIVVERYHFFGSSCRQFSVSGQSLTQMMRDEMEMKGYLASMLNVLCSVHQRFFDKHASSIAQLGFGSRDVRQILKEVRAKVLEGCTIVFSRIFPTDYPAELHHYWRMAEELGAKCSTSVNHHVTHVVALDSGTDKSRWAIQNNRFLVQPSWLEASNALWQKQDEEKYTFSAIKGSPISTFLESTTERSANSVEYQNDVLQNVTKSTDPK
eukprot:TRINITY_DN2723_c0_g2_i1.p1 TRINITY_DN2723_c0_g2~~TRINITY_DN2723_c0_g2_i1.p1  ORF type:complete len:519 (-),score=110.99 TRINITY_DN2723_c0_g2_i1:215-1771(-)